ncbi:MAG: hypothetical protein VB144_05095, partial [Clostridia bacterium]|nr:hypothetical protein [Clostridia bacterium]
QDVQVCNYADMWCEGDEGDSRSELDLDLLASLAASVEHADDDPAARIRQLLEGELGVDNPAYEFARLMGLANYEWTSHMYMAGDYDEESFPGVVQVN